MRCSFFPCSFSNMQLAASDALLEGRLLEGLDPDVRPSPSTRPDKLPHPDGRATVPVVTCASPVLPIDLRHSSCRAFRIRRSGERESPRYHDIQLTSPWGWSRPLLLHPRCIIEDDSARCGASHPFPLYRSAPPPQHPAATCVLCEMEILPH